MKRSQLAINSISTQGSLEEKLAAYSKAGFRYVEFALGQPKEYLAGGHTPKDLKGRLEKHGLGCIGGFEGGLSGFGSDEERAKNRAQIVENCRLLAELGGSILVVGTDGPKEPMEDSLGTLAEAFARTAEQVKDIGVTICIEFNWSPLVKSLRTAVEVAERSGVGNVGVLFDPAHYHCTPSNSSRSTRVRSPSSGTFMWTTCGTCPASCPTATATGCCRVKAVSISPPSSASWIGTATGASTRLKCSTRSYGSFRQTRLHARCTRAC
jgi:hydroxypyruvate isomerase